ncbi:hypothetical protein L6R53_06385 [Myxococcota bacterium]|nr:hypothetical protein [Myxococcota bacterium]
MALLPRARSLLALLALGFAALPAPAMAQDDDDFDFLEDEEDDDKKDEGEEPGGEQPAGEESGDELGFDGTPTPEEDDFDFTEPDEEGDLDVQIDTTGLDDAAAYKAKQKEVEGMTPEDEAIEWERYLRKYPNSQFESRIEARLDKLSELMYSGRIESAEEVEEKGLAEIYFAQPFTLESIDPRKKLRAGIEFGLPGYLAPIVDFEWAFLRNLSAHAGVRGRYGGVSFEPGVRYAVIKSARSNTLLTVLGDVRVNTGPAYVGFRPQLAFGQRIPAGDIEIDASLQGGTELVTYGIFSPRVVGGANVSIAPSDTVKFFLETSTYMKDLGWDQGGSFRFNVVSFGVKFMERNKGKASRFEAGAGAIAPYSSNYWSFHSGALGLDLNYYL